MEGEFASATQGLGRRRDTVTDALTDEIAFAMEAPASLLPHLAYLLQDLPSLSGSEIDAVAVLAEVGFPTGGTILDLGCGRGDIAIRMAQAFDASVTGIDAHAPFVALARRAAREAGLEDRCRFAAGDLRQALTGPARFDAALMIAVGPVLGDAAATVGPMRTVVRPGGWILIDDAYLPDDIAPPPDDAGYLDRRAMETGLTRHGDTIVARRTYGPTTQAFNALTLETVPKRAAELAAAHPELKADLDRYVARQFEEVALMDGPVVPALWAIRKNGA